MHNEQEAIHEEEYQGYKISIYPDSEAGGEGPRDWDNFGTMLAWHSRYTIGDAKPTDLIYLTEKEAEEYGQEYLDLSQAEDARYWLQREAKAGRLIYLMLYTYEHGGITMSSQRTGQFADAFDSSCVGFIYATREQILAEWPGRMSKGKIEKALRLLEDEVKTYADYMEGNVAGYVIETVDEARPPLDDSCWGYYPDHDKQNEWQFLIDECRAEIDAHLQRHPSQLRLPVLQAA